MTAESASDRQQQWVLVVRRSFDIPDLVGNEDAREALMAPPGAASGEWVAKPHRGTAAPIVDALMAFGASEEIDDQLLPVGLGLSAPTFTTQDVAYRLLDRAMTVVDPEHLVFDVMSELPPEVVAVTQQVLDRVFQYVREQPFGG